MLNTQKEADLQLGFDFDFSKNSENEVKENEPRYISGFNITIPDALTYFGELSDDPANCPLEKKRQQSNQAGLFGEGSQLIEMSISDFILAHKCPKVFNGYLNKGFPLSHPHHQIFDIGTCVDKVAKEYLRLPIVVRSEKQPILRQKLQHEIQKFALSHEKELEFLNAFDDFCAYFNKTKLADNFDSNKKLVFEFEDFRLSGKIDFLIQDNDKTLTLLDLKLISVGNDVDHLQFYDIIQIKLYAYAFLCRGIEIKKVGYYYLIERTLIIEEVTPIELQRFAEILKRFANSLARTKNFCPRKCAYCLICPLREKCEIGSQLTRDDFTIPLE